MQPMSLHPYALGKTFPVWDPQAAQLAQERFTSIQSIDAAV